MSPAPLRSADRLFAGLVAVQWFLAVWLGHTSALSDRKVPALAAGLLLTVLPLALVSTRALPRARPPLVALCAMLLPAVLGWMMGAVPGSALWVSLAFVSFYRNRWLCVGAGIFAAGLLALWGQGPDTVLGVAAVTGLLAWGCHEAEKEVETERARAARITQDAERQTALALETAMSELESSHQTVMKIEKLAGVGKLAASVGHELRNPLAAIRNAHTYLAKKVLDPAAEKGDARVKQFTQLIDRELDNCSRIISDLLDYARERAPVRRPTPLKPLADEALSMLPPRASVQVHNDIDVALPIPSVDKDQLRQVLINLLQNALEAIPPEQAGEVRIAAEGGGSEAWRIFVTDNGAGIPDHVVHEIFQPLFTTKTKGTGLGLAIVSGMVERHGGHVRVHSQLGKGTCFTVELPPSPPSPEERA